MEKKFLFTVTIADHSITTPILAVDKFQAIELVYSQYQVTEPDRTKYTAKKKKI